MKQLKVEKWKEENSNSGVSSITLIRDEKELIISFQGNLDLYFSLINYDKSPTFIIGKDNYKVYEIFDTLYHDVVNGITFYENNEEDINRIIFFSECNSENYHKELKRIEERHLEQQEDSVEFARRIGLIENESIIWRSDDYYPEVAPYFKIDKLENAYLITFNIPRVERELTLEEIFELPKLKENFISVRLRNHGSRYNYFNIPFMKFYNTLMNLDLNDNQIYLEEYLIEEELKQGVPLETILTKTKKIGR